MLYDDIKKIDWHIVLKGLFPGILYAADAANVIRTILSTHLPTLMIFAPNFLIWYGTYAKKQDSSSEKVDDSHFIHSFVNFAATANSLLVNSSAMVYGLVNFLMACQFNNPLLAVPLSILAFIYGYHGANEMTAKNALKFTNMALNNTFRERIEQDGYKSILTESYKAIGIKNSAAPIIAALLSAVFASFQYMTGVGFINLIDGLALSYGITSLSTLAVPFGFFCFVITAIIMFPTMLGFSLAEATPQPVQSVPNPQPRPTRKIVSMIIDWSHNVTTLSSIILMANATIAPNSFWFTVARLPFNLYIRSVMASLVAFCFPAIHGLLDQGREWMMRTSSDLLSHTFATEEARTGATPLHRPPGVAHGH